MKDTDRQRIERALEEFDAWRASAMALKAYVQLRGEELSHWRARLSWERRWRQMLNGTYTKDTQARSAFVQATPNQTRTTAKPHPLSPPQSALHPAQQTTLRIVINAKGGALQASVEWPLDGAIASSAWLREVLS